MTEWQCGCTACKEGLHPGGGHCGASINGCVPDITVPLTRDKRKKGTRKEEHKKGKKKA